MNARIKAVLLVLAGVIAGLVLAPPAVQAATNYFDVTKTVTGTGTAYCGSGWKVTGGGVYTLPNDYYGSLSSDEYSLTGSYPNSSSSWRATGNKVHGTYSSSYGWRFTKYSYSPRVYAICTS